MHVAKRIVSLGLWQDTRICDNLNNMKYKNTSQFSQTAADFCLHSARKRKKNAVENRLIEIISFQVQF